MDFPPVSSPAERVALKEWAVLCDAMARGDIVAMVRKGGVREQWTGFTVRHDRFLLYPTYFHEKAAELAPRFAGALASLQAERPPSGFVRLELVATVAAVWAVDDLDRLPAIEHEHGLAWDAVRSRFHYRQRPGLHVIAVELSRLRVPAELPEIRRYAGCVSWVALESAVEVAHAERVVAPADFAARLRRLCDALGAPTEQTPPP